MGSASLAPPAMCLLYVSPPRTLGFHPAENSSIRSSEDGRVAFRWAPGGYLPCATRHSPLRLGINQSVKTGQGSGTSGPFLLFNQLQFLTSTQKEGWQYSKFVNQADTVDSRRQEIASHRRLRQRDRLGVFCDLKCFLSRRPCPTAGSWCSPRASLEGTMCPRRPREGTPSTSSGWRTEAVPNR